MNRLDSGHINLSRGQPVEYAGQLRFSRDGQLKSWNNASGHYEPRAVKAPQAGLPMDKFIPLIEQ